MANKKEIPSSGELFCEGLEHSQFPYAGDIMDSIKINEQNSNTQDLGAKLPYFLSEEGQEDYRRKVNLAKMEASQRANGIGYHVDIIHSKPEPKKSNKWQNIGISLAALVTAGAFMWGYSNTDKPVRETSSHMRYLRSNCVEVYNGQIDGDSVWTVMTRRDFKDEYLTGVGDGGVPTDSAGNTIISRLIPDN